MSKDNQASEQPQEKPTCADGIREILTDEIGNVTIDITPLDKKLSATLESEEAEAEQENHSTKQKKKPLNPNWLATSFLDDISYKALEDGSVLYMYKGKEAFIDHGDHIVMCNKNENEERIILGAIKLANEKYHSSFEITGSEEFQRKAIAIMVKYNIDIELKNPAQELIRQEYLKNYKVEQTNKAHDGFIAATELKTSEVLALPPGQEVNESAQKKRRTRP